MGWSDRLGAASAVIAAAALSAGAMGQAVEQVETFDTGGFSNPVFEHELEYEGCCIGFPDSGIGGGPRLHLFPNRDTIGFALAPGGWVSAARVTIEDHEGGFAGSPTSVLIARGVSGDFAFVTAENLFSEEVVEIDGATLGRLTGRPLRRIIGLTLSASNENLGDPGAYFDNLTITVESGPPPCVADWNLDGSVTPTDVAAFVVAWFDDVAGGSPEALEGDFDLNFAVDPADVAAFVGAWFAAVGGGC